MSASCLGTSWCCRQFIVSVVPSTRDWGTFGRYLQQMIWFSFLWKQSSSSNSQLLCDANKCAVSDASWEICFRNTLLLQNRLSENPPNDTSLGLPPTCTSMWVLPQGTERKRRNAALITASQGVQPPSFTCCEMGALGIHVAPASFGTFILAFPEQIFWKPFKIFVHVIKCRTPQ